MRTRGSLSGSYHLGLGHGFPNPWCGPRPLQGHHIFNKVGVGDAVVELATPEAPVPELVRDPVHAAHDDAMHQRREEEPAAMIPRY